MKLWSTTLLLGALTGAVPAVMAQALERMQPTDASLDCAALAQESRAMEGVIAQGTAGGLGTAAAGTAANVGGQVAGATVAQSVGGLFGALGSVVAKVSGAVAQQATEQQMAPDAAARQRAEQAQSRKDFLARLSTARDCGAGGPGKTLTAEQLQQLAGTGMAAGEASGFTPTAMTLASVQPALAQAITPLPLPDAFDSNLVLKGKRFYIAEFRVLFDVGGEVSASTRGGYLLGRDYGSTRTKVTYAVPNPDIAAFQAITDRAFEDLKARLATAGIKTEDAQAVTREHGEIYEASQAASQPGAPVYFEKNLGHAQRKYLVMAPTGMKVVPRGFTGMGAGQIGKRIEWSKNNLEALSISIAVNISNLESSGSGSSIFRRGSSASAAEGMTIMAAPDSHLAQSHAFTQTVAMKKALEVGGGFARFRETSSYDSDKDPVARVTGVLTNLAGMGANKSARVEMAVDLDGPSMGSMALRGLATINQVLAEKIKAGM